MRSRHRDPHPNETAPEAYARAKRDLEATLAAVRKVIDEHAAKRATSTNWGYAGDLTEWNRRIRETFAVQLGLET